MRAELLSDLLAVARGHFGQKSPVTPVTPVTGSSGYRSKPSELQGLQALQIKKCKLEKEAFQPETKAETDLAESIRDTIEERKALCAGAIPPIYLDTWARLNHQKPIRVSDADWRLALDDGGRFLDRWGSEAALWGWTASDLFDVPRAGQGGGLIWRISGATVEVCGPDRTRLSDGRRILRNAARAE